MPALGTSPFFCKRRGDGFWVSQFPCLTLCAAATARVRVAQRGTLWPQMTRATVWCWCAGHRRSSGEQSGGEGRGEGRGGVQLLGGCNPTATGGAGCLPTPLPNHGAITMFAQPPMGPCTSCVGLLVQAPSLTTHYHAPFTLAQSASCLRAWSILKGWNITVDDGYAGCYAPPPNP